MPAQDTSISRFLSTIYPYMHMKLYNAIRENEKLRNEISELVDDLIKNPESTRQILKLQAKEHPDSLISHALRILVNLSEKGDTAILAQLRDAPLKFNINEPVEGIVLQAVISDRWLKHNWDSTFDLILAIPAFSKVIAISTTEAEIPIDPIIPRLAKVHLEKAYLYSFFNRAHAVKGRRVSSNESYNENVIDARQFKPFMRSCSDLESIGKGTNIAFFTPFSTNDGLKLGFFFTLMCKVNSVESIISPAGVGLTYEQVGLVLYDFSGFLKARLNTSVFIESMQNPTQQSGIKLEDPLDLNKFSRPIFIVGVWILGQQYPEVLFLGIPKDDLGMEFWGILAFMNSHRKVSYDNLVRVFNKDAVEKVLMTDNLVRSGNWIFYVEDGWPKEIFPSLEKNSFQYITLPEALKLGASFSDYNFWLNKILPFFRINPRILELYRSREPMGGTYEKLHEIIPTKDTNVLTCQDEKVKSIEQKTKIVHQTETGLKCPVCGMNSVIRDISPSDGYYVEFCQSGISTNIKEGKLSSCKYWGSGWTRKID